MICMCIMKTNKTKKRKKKGHESRNADASVKERGMTEGAYREKRNNDVTLLLAIVFALFFFLYDFLRSLSLSLSLLYLFVLPPSLFFFLTLCHFFYLVHTTSSFSFYLSVLPSFSISISFSVATALPLLPFFRLISSRHPRPFPFLPPYLPA